MLITFADANTKWTASLITQKTELYFKTMVISKRNVMKVIVKFNMVSEEVIQRIKSNAQI